MNVGVDAVHAMNHSLKLVVFPLFHYHIWIGALFLQQSFSNIISVQTYFSSLFCSIRIKWIAFISGSYFCNLVQTDVIFCTLSSCCFKHKWLRLFTFCSCSIWQDLRLKSSFIQNWRFLRMAISWIFDHKTKTVQCYEINETITEDRLASQHLCEKKILYANTKFPYSIICKLKQPATG